MKGIKLFGLAICLTMSLIACNNSGSTSNTKDTTGDRTLPPPPDNSSATNPSLADTAYAPKDTMKTHGDSVRK